MKMRHNVLSVAIAALSAFALGLSSCSEPVKPHDENHDKDHDEAYRVEVTLTGGHFHGNHFHATSPISGAKHYDANVQKMIFQADAEKGFALVKGSPKAFAVIGGLKDGKKPVDPASAAWSDDKFVAQNIINGTEPYNITVRFFAKDGDEITKEFGTPEEARIHQLFFIPENTQATKFGDPKKTYTSDYRFIGYYYMDTTPWNAPEGKFTGISNPIGLNGAIEFYEPNTSFDLRIRLMHAKNSKYISEGKTSPFYKPTAQQLSREDWEDLDLRIPVVVFADDSEFLEADSFESMTAKDKALVDKLSDALGITAKEAFQDLLLAKKAKH